MPAKSSPGKAGKTTGRPAAPMQRMSSLSSFQPPLSFGYPTSSKPSASSSSSSRQNGGRNGNATRSMPPPPVGYQTKTKAASGKSDPQVPGLGIKTVVRGEELSPKAAGKRKAQEVIEILDDDDDEDDGDMADDLVKLGSQQIWADAFAPIIEDDLAPGKARVQRVKTWLYKAVHGVSPDSGVDPDSVSTAAKDRLRKYRRILILTGPAGIGKTTTVKVLASELGLDLAEWDEGADTGAGSYDRESGIAKLSQFLLRNTYDPLQMTTAAAGPSRHPARSRSSPRVLLLSSLPNISHGPTKDAFQAMLLEFCRSYNSFSSPLVIIHSDAGSGGRAEESWMDRDRTGREGAIDILGKQVKDGPWCQEVDFLPLAFTFLQKAIKRVLNLAVKSDLDKPSPGALHLIAISCNGDLRSAINSLQILCQQRAGAKAGSARWLRDISGPPSTKKAKTKSGKKARLVVGEDVRAMLDAVTRREQSLGLFHALGKVFYNKRLGDPGEEDEDQELLNVIRHLPRDDPLPFHLQPLTRRKALAQMEAFLPTIPVDASSFGLWLHQNLPTFTEDVEQTSEGLEYLCAADVMRTDDDIWQSSTQAISYALHLTIRGVQMSLPSPVPRGGHKLLKPQFFAQYRREKENIGLLDTAAAHLVKKGIAASKVLADQPLNQQSDSHPAWSGLLTKKVLATEMLPFMFKIGSLARHTLLPSSVAPLLLPAYSSMATQAEELSLKDNDSAMEAASFDQDAAGEDGLGDVPSGVGWDDDEPDASKEDEQKWLEEDDIEDFD